MWLIRLTSVTALSAPVDSCSSRASWATLQGRSGSTACGVGTRQGRSRGELSS